MALSNYTELQAAVRTEMANVGTGGLSADALDDCIARAEAKISRKVRLREAEQLAYATYSATATHSDYRDRLLALPSGYVELINLSWKYSNAADLTYEPVDYVEPRQMPRFYDDERFVYTLRDQIEFNSRPSRDKTILMHYLKRWDIATDSTNWLLTNYPDAYLFGSCMEAALHLKKAEETAAFKLLFEQALSELDNLSQRGRDDFELDTSELASMSVRSTYNILTGG